jgi:hypothetical protein
MEGMIVAEVLMSSSPSQPLVASPKGGIFEKNTKGYLAGKQRSGAGR